LVEESESIPNGGGKGFRCDDRREKDLGAIVVEVADFEAELREGEDGLGGFGCFFLVWGLG